MVVEENPTNFSPEDSNNVSIPNALGPIAFEFFPNYVFLLKSGKNLIGIDQTMEIFLTIAGLNKEFFKNGHRFCKEVWPHLKSIIEKHCNDKEHYLKKKIIKKIFKLINELSLFADEEYKSGCCLKTKEEIKNFEMIKENTL